MARRSGVLARDDETVKLTLAGRLAKRRRDVVARASWAASSELSPLLEALCPRRYSTHPRRQHSRVEGTREIVPDPDSNSLRQSEVPLETLWSQDLDVLVPVEVKTLERIEDRREFIDLPVTQEIDQMV
jgi:hypothetical protein